MIKVEYIWLDGGTPQQLRSKVKVLPAKRDSELFYDIEKISLEDVPEWNFDGSSTNQAGDLEKFGFDGTDCLLKPIKLIEDWHKSNAYICLCEVMNPDDTPHITNNRHLLPDEEKDDFWFGFEQEYFMMDGKVPLGFRDPVEGKVNPQGQYYCGVGTQNVVGRELVERHMDVCLHAGLNITGVNAEVALGQWEYQLFGKTARDASDDLWLSRFLLYRLAESYGVVISLHPKPLTGDWNGSGMHANFSNTYIREHADESGIKTICEMFVDTHEEHIKVYGIDNDKRLTGKHETQDINKFSYGVSDRGASIRIPLTTVRNGWKGYLEDRRPASNADPYEVSYQIIKTVDSKLLK